MAISRRPGYYEAREHAWKPIATYGLLGVIGAIFLTQLALRATGNDGLEVFLFIIGPDWMHRPWTLITATLSHANFTHILFNGIILFFFGPILERILGLRVYLALFFVAGAIASVLQVHLTELIFGVESFGLGASGALMMVFGALMVLMPKQQILLFGIVPMPFWLAGIGFAVIDILGAINPLSGVGNFAHLSGMAIGLVVGVRVRQDLKRQGLRLQTG